MMFLVISAVLAGNTDWTHIEIFGKGQLEWLQNYFPFTNGIPSYDTMSRVFARLDNEQFSDYFTRWIRKLNE